MWFKWWLFGGGGLSLKVKNNIIINGIIDCSGYNGGDIIIQSNSSNYKRRSQITNDNKDDRNKTPAKIVLNAREIDKISNIFYYPILHICICFFF